jgi:hypothetical protein
VTLPGGRTVPFNPLKEAAFHALSNAYSLGYLICGAAALAATVLVLTAVGGRPGETQIDPRSLAD